MEASFCIVKYAISYSQKAWWKTNTRFRAALRQEETAE